MTAIPPFNRNRKTIQGCVLTFSLMLLSVPLLYGTTATDTPAAVELTVTPNNVLLGIIQNKKGLASKAATCTDDLKLKVDDPTKVTAVAFGTDDTSVKVSVTGKIDECRQAASLSVDASAVVGDVVLQFKNSTATITITTPVFGSVPFPDNSHLKFQ